MRLARFSNHLTFLVRCIKNAVVPKDLRVKPLVPTKGARRAAETASLRFLRERIQLTRRTKRAIQSEVDSTLKGIESTLTITDRSRMIQKIDNRYRREFEKCKARQLAKFQDLAEGRSTRLSSRRPTESIVDTSKWVLNLSARTLSTAEESLLGKGLNFAVTPDRVPATEIVANVETALKRLDPEAADLVRREVNSTLRKARPPAGNITREQRAALRSLREDRSITILPADKGRASVVLDADIYRDKMNQLITSGPYRKLKKDPTDRLCRKVVSQLLALNRAGDLDDGTYRKLRPTSKQPPRIYGLPKIHKPGTPLRPIVSCVSSFAYDLSKHLAGILSPMTGKTSNTVPNSTAFAEFVRGQRIGSHETLVSFDVESLFTNVPIDGACRVARQRLEGDPTLPDRSSLSPTSITVLLEFVLRSTYFLHEGTFYKQTDGAAMGSPVSAVIANLYMEAFEEEALLSCPPDCRPTVWKRYVDDTFVIAPRDQTDQLLAHLNSRQPTIRFTTEVEHDNTIAFLDTLVHREADGSLTTTVYRKPTHTDQYLAYDSHHPEFVKRGVAKCLHDRASRLVTRPRCTGKERHHVRAALAANGYPPSLVRQASRPRTKADSEQLEYKSFVVLPFVDGISMQLKRTLEGHGVRTVFRSSTTLRNQLVRPKDPVPPERRGGVVYKIPCGQCSKVYIGETGRPIGERIKEHQRDVRLGRVDGSAVAEHALEAGHHPNWDDVQCVDREQHWYTRRIKEAIHIRLQRNNVNRDSGVDIPGFWLPTIRHHDRPGPRGATEENRRVTRLMPAARYAPDSGGHSAGSAASLDHRPDTEGATGRNRRVTRMMSAARRAPINGDSGEQDKNGLRSVQSSVA